MDEVRLGDGDGDDDDGDGDDEGEPDEVSVGVGDSLGSVVGLGSADGGWVGLGIPWGEGVANDVDVTLLGLTGRPGRRSAGPSSSAPGAPTSRRAIVGTVGCERGSAVGNVTVGDLFG